MPGGRLTRQDRREIADGLSAGLGYAGIARRLGRPTSTVSREVARNGGPDGYRPDRAQRESDRRARRGGGAPARPGTVRERPGRDAEEVRAFEESLAGALARSGMTATPSRVLACLFSVDDSGLTAADLVRRLGVSPASVSLAVGYLEGQGLLQRARQGRRDLYTVDGNVWYRSVEASIRANAEIAETARRGARALGPDTPAGRRLVHTGELLERVGEALLRTVEEWPPACGGHGPAGDPA
ncbi:helix-turn-helix domain-containing protein [Nocardiopsis sp. N85]|uniref:GbsR/MarR family transcriptional regulator n=1 Tax=Nocardiopsis sp. N85 TaxID=3029400 RepID=UPI00237F9D9F|nr:helix-turn-helix domain-containing protein [Nocardiopsis sp. N85]MDE3720707.1 helix-turn-helix domain-containing protein [Nocardiopsis sp. N85]